MPRQRRERVAEGVARTGQAGLVENVGSERLDRRLVDPHAIVLQEFGGRGDRLVHGAALLVELVVVAMSAAAQRLGQHVGEVHDLDRIDGLGARQRPMA